MVHCWLLEISFNLKIPAYGCIFSWTRAASCYRSASSPCELLTRADTTQTCVNTVTCVAPIHSRCVQKYQSTKDNRKSYLKGECRRADGTFLCLGESTEEEEDTESASASRDHQPHIDHVMTSRVGTKRCLLHDGEKIQRSGALHSACFRVFHRLSCYTPSLRPTVCEDSTPVRL